MVVKYSLVFFIVFFVFSIDEAYSQYEGDACEKDGVPGVCSPLRRCRSAINDLMRGKNPKNCSFQGNTPIVCCVTSAGGVATTCPGIPPSAIKIKKTGRKASDKCIDWEEYIYPCGASGALLLGGPKTRTDQCSHSVAPLIVGGTAAGRDEFPHMALLGFDDPANGGVKWACGGTLISERWVMTAGHCLWLRDTETDVKHVRLGTDNEDAKIDPQRVHTIEKIVPHPEYKGTSIYNDIGLLKLDRDAKLSKSVIPACLHLGNTLQESKYLASGWGDVNEGGARSKKLLKVTLEHFRFDECSRKHPASKKSRDGVRDATQICAGHHTEVKDTCQGDSGGPLQVYNLDVYCTYTIVGITSTGKGCGTPGVPALYTRVSAFVPWIESVVWP